MEQDNSTRHDKSIFNSYKSAVLNATYLIFFLGGGVRIERSITSVYCAINC